MSQKGLFSIRFLNAEAKYSLVTYFVSEVDLDQDGFSDSDYTASDLAHNIEQFRGFSVAYDYFFVGMLSDLPCLSLMDVDATFRNGSFTFI